MQCFTWRMGKLIPGIDVVVDKKFGPVVFLGQEGDGRRYEKIQLARRDPAVVVGGRIYEAEPRRVLLRVGEPDEHQFWVLERPRGPKDERILVRICTEGVEEPGSRGYWFESCGMPLELIKGHGARDVKGRGGLWDDGLFILQEDDIIQIMPEGGAQVEAYGLYLLDGQFGTMPWRALMALGGDEEEMGASDSEDPREEFTEVHDSVAPVIQLRPETAEELSKDIDQRLDTLEVVADSEEEELRKLAAEIAALEAAEQKKTGSVMS
jgi:hypothetical protein